ncbi:MAG: hypothetical protein M9894_06405 [Planctomycetes bacterium]|nr:hypothetical protein [Planctomycetota bacterium]
MKPAALAAAAALLASAAPALADEPGRDGGALLVGPFLAAVVTYPLGLAVHLLVLAFAPRRGAGLVEQAEAHRWKTLLLGAAHAAFLLLVLAAAAGRAPGLAALVVALWGLVVLVGLHGVARAIGARVLDESGGAGGAHEVRALAVGWFVVVFASAFPGLGWLLFPYWALRATGAAVLAVFSPGAAAPDDRPPP